MAKDKVERAMRIMARQLVFNAVYRNGELPADVNDGDLAFELTTDGEKEHVIYNGDRWVRLP